MATFPTSAMATIRSDTGAMLSALIFGAGLGYTYAKLVSAGESRRLPVETIASPLRTLLGSLTKSQISALPYSPYFLPGGRDVDTPYGSMKVYELGPESGKKVILIPGDGTPAPLFGQIAQSLSSQGYRVMVIDNWGRGYSDSPKDVPYNAALFVQQTFFAICSSNLTWTGSDSNGFSLIGFSLGGSIAMSIAAHFPYLVNSIVLLAPAGLLQDLPQSYKSPFFRYRSLVPRSILRRSLAQLLGTTLEAKSLPSEDTKESSLESLDFKAISKWQFDYHEGFQHSFIDTIQNGPSKDQQEVFQKVCSYITGEAQQAANITVPCRLRGSKLLVICGEDDDVVTIEETFGQISKMLPASHLVLRTVPGTHNFPAYNYDLVLQHVYEHWSPSR